MQAKKSHLIFMLKVLILSIIPTVCLHTSYAQNPTQMSLPEGAIARLGKGEIQDLSYSPDGKVFALASTNGIWLYDTATYHEFKLLPIPLSRTIVFWDITTGLHKQTLKDRQTLKSQLIFLCCAFSPDGKYLVVGSYESSLRVWNTGTGKLEKTLNGLSHIVSDLIFTQDGTTLITSGDGAILVWDFASLINGSAIN